MYRIEAGNGSRKGTVFLVANTVTEKPNLSGINPNVRTLTGITVHHYTIDECGFNAAMK